MKFEEIPDGQYVTELNDPYVFKKQGDLLIGIGFQTTNHSDKRFVFALPDEIAKFENEIKEREVRAAEHLRKETELLSRYGLSHDDFQRFREVYAENNQLIVRTRENGMDLVSVEAIRKPNYVSQHTDEFDSTYEYYVFSPLLTTNKT